MGAAQSFVSSETAITAAVLAGAVALGINQYNPNQSPEDAKTKDGSPAPKKGKKKKSTASLSQSGTAAVAPSPKLTATTIAPSAIPGGFESASAADATSDGQPPKAKKAKKKKAKSPAVAGTGAPSSADNQSESSVGNKPPSTKAKRQAAALRSLTQSTMSIDTDGSWTRVEPRRRTAHEIGGPSTETNTSDAGVTGNSSPTTEKTEDEAPARKVNQKTLAEKLLPKPRRTGVDDMLEKPDYPTFSRVMRVAPAVDEKPASGFSWGDYEDVNESVAGNDADREDDGWGVVKSKGRTRTERTPPQSQSQSQTLSDSAELSKRQRQNAKKRDALKAAKADIEADRQAGLAKHKRELEKVRITEQFSGKGKGSKTASGGMSATVDSNGKLVWE